MKSEKQKSLPGNSGQVLRKESEEPGKESWELYICGARGSRPVHGEEFKEFGGATSCYLLKKGEYALMVDCGSGLGSAGKILAGCKRIDVLLTHVHYDHIIGLLGWSVFPAKARLHFFGDFDKWLGEASLEAFFRPPFWPVVPTGLPCTAILSPGKFKLSDEVSVAAFPSCHPDSTSIFRIEAGGKPFCVLFDYEHQKEPPTEALAGCVLMIYDGMFTEEEYPAHRGWGHSCWEEGCRLAEKYGISRLLITHHAPERTDRELRALEAAARERFPNLSFARAGARIFL